MRQTRVLMARHGETSAPDRFHGAESDVGLSAAGARQAELLGEYLRTNGATAVYSSTMRRAVDTALPIARACDVVPVPIASLHERRIGALSGLSREDGWAVYAASKLRWIAGDLDHTHEGGESYNDVRRRVVPIMQELAAACWRDHHRHRPRRCYPRRAHQHARGGTLPSSTESRSISRRSTTFASMARSGRLTG